MEWFSVRKQLHDARDGPDDGKQALTAASAIAAPNSQYDVEHTGMNGMPLFRDSKFHHAVFLGIGFHNRMIASHVIVATANSKARNRKHTANLQFGKLMYSWSIVLAETENPLSLNILRIVLHQPTPSTHMS